MWPGQPDSEGLPGHVATLSRQRNNGQTQIKNLNWNDLNALEQLGSMAE